MFKKVVLAMDFSGPAMELFNSVPDLKKLGLEELVVVHVVRYELVEDSISPYRERFVKRIESKRKELLVEGHSIDVKVLRGAPAEEIVRFAEEENTDLILIGSVGESFVRELFLGSTVADVIRTAGKPVLVEKYRVVGEKAERVPIFSQKLLSVLLPTDFSADAEEVYHKFLAEGTAVSRVTLVHVIDRGTTVEQLESSKESARQKLNAWRQEFAAKGVSAEVRIAVGIPSREILAIAEEEGATLIAMPRRGKGLIANLLIGSTADAVVRRSSRPVLLFNVLKNKMQVSC